MHWLTAIFGFVTLYFVGGLLYSLLRSADLDAVLFFGVGILLCAALGAANEFRARRKLGNTPSDPA